MFGKLLKGIGGALGGGAKAAGGALAGAGGAIRDANRGGPAATFVDGPNQRKIMGMPVGRSPVLDAVKAAGPALSGVFGKRNKRKANRSGKR